ncbi:MAG: hypothetical protein GY894_05955 [Planctomycetes bacterium]|nr:hypothetical protein [Planctomycetota bacterium]
MDSFNTTNADEIVAMFQHASKTLLDTPGRIGCRVKLPNQGSLLISGDLHDHLPNYHRIVTAAALHEPGHHVVLQELIHGPSLVHGCDMSWRMLARVARLIQEFPGQVHPLLGNHENSQLTGVGVTKGGGNSVELFEDGVALTFGEDWERVGGAIDRFLRSMPLAVSTASGVQCSHSLPDAVLMNRFDVGILDRELLDDDRRGVDGSAYLMTWGRRFSDEQIEALASKWGVKCFIIGHLQVPQGVLRASEKVMALASDTDTGAALIMNLGSTVDPDALFESVRPIQVLPACEPLL